jgi:hypothetical protein
LTEAHIYEHWAMEFSNPKSTFNLKLLNYICFFSWPFLPLKGWGTKKIKIKIKN